MADLSAVAHSSAALKFRTVTFNAVARNGQPWLKAAEIAQALGYANADAVGKLYSRNAGEFTAQMTETVNLTVSRNGGELTNETRIFSLRGAHLIGMFARTELAAEFRRWVLDVLDREVGQSTPAPSTQTAVAPAPKLTPLWAGIGKMEFEGNTFHLVLIGGEPYASVREVTRAMGVDTQGQASRLKVDEEFWRLRMATFPTNGGPHESLAIPVGMITTWLTSIKSMRISALAKERLAAWAKKLGPAMLVHWWANEGSPANRVPLSDPEVKELDLALEEGAKLMGTAGEQALFPVQARVLLAEEFGVESYRDIPCSKFCKALAWVTRHTMAVAATPFKTSQATAGAKRWLLSLDEDGNEHFQRLPADVVQAPWRDLVAGVEAGQRQFDEVLGMFQACGKFLQSTALALPASSIPFGAQVKLI